MTVGAQLIMTLGLMMLSMFIVGACGYLMRNNSVETETELYENYGKTQGEAAMGFAQFQEVKCEIISCSNLISRLFNKRICLIKTSVHFFRRLIIIIDHLTMNVCSKYNSHIRIHSCSRCIVCRLRTACQNYISSLCFLCHSRYTVT